MCYCTDSDLSSFLLKARTKGLNLSSDGIFGKTGLVYVKENVAGAQFILDKSDNSVMRTDK